MSSKEITISIVDDHPVVLEGLHKLLSEVSGMVVTACHTTAQACLEAMEFQPTDVLLLDINLPDMKGADLCKAIKTIAPTTHILAFSNHSERSLILQLLQNGASGYLLKNASAEELISCIQEANNGLITFSKAVREIMARPSALDLQGTPQLTTREKEILHLISDGKTTPEIAAQLNLSPMTVETHRKNLMHKFQSKNVAALIKAAITQGFI
ncbi:response regulator transcription factor [Chitinophaga sp. sic0106]|uniref:response regulator transcription factor n=1 Tax=Chitinophaga sp. sic0106 TaxID=2854785 RepID=UPI001C469827|nr:response regulator transcription factor [Chitinophaga sp. sic0106]MBV7529238.1 response regulator transcription factor [Chitinophaga sp. sic0106]